MKVNERLKLNARRILATFRFSSNLAWAGVWNSLQRGVASHLARLGQQLDFFYQQEELRNKVGYVTGGLQAHSVDSTPAPQQLQQLIPAQFCSSAVLENVDEITRSELECTYIHFLRLLATAVDERFQRKVKAVLADHNIKFVHYSGGIKGFECMLLKTTSEDDYGLLPKPRPSYNNDINRCLVTFETVSDLEQGIPLLATVFDGGYNKFNNGMGWSPEEAAEKHHLRLILGTGRFLETGFETIGDYRRDPGAQKLWEDYCLQQKVPPNIGRRTWQRCVHQAMQWVRELPDKWPVWMNCEVQMLLRPYTLIRRRMHELYKVSRSATDLCLYNEYARLQEEEALKRQHGQDGSTPLKLACRDGDVAAVGQLLSQDGLQEHVDSAFLVACDYGQEHCATALLDRSATLMEGLIRCVHPKSDFALTVNGHSGCVESLLTAKADTEKAASDGSSAVHLASQNGHSRVLQLLIAAKTDIARPCITDGSTPIMMATNNDHLSAVNMLVRAKANVNRYATAGFTATILAGGSGRRRVLVDAKAEVNRPNSRTGSTAALRAATGGQHKALEFLIHVKADINIPSNKGETPAHAAAQHGFDKIMQLLITAKAELNCKHRNRTPRGWAAKNKHSKLLKLLIEAKARP